MAARALVHTAVGLRWGALSSASFTYDQGAIWLCLCVPAVSMCLAHTIPSVMRLQKWAQRTEKRTEVLCLQCPRWSRSAEQSRDLLPLAVCLGFHYDRPFGGRVSREGSFVALLHFGVSSSNASCVLYDFASMTELSSSLLLGHYSRDGMDST